jgi:tetratricopeptide (TPR) repeat protein
MSLPSALARDAQSPRLTYRDLLACLSVVLLAALVYLNALHNPFVYDDHRLILDNRSIEHLTNLRSIVLHEVTRPVVNFTYALDYALWGRTPFGFHLTNLLLHLLNITLVYVLAWRISDDRRLRGLEGADQPGPGVVAFSAAVLFAVHPMMTEAVGYVAARAEVLCATLFLLAVLAMRRWMIRGGVVWLVLSIGAWLLALASKETAVMFPFVILAYDRLVCPGTAKDRQWRLLHVHLPFYILGALVAATRLAVFSRAENVGGIRVVWSFILAEIDVMRRYLLELLVVEPNSQAIFHSVPLVSLFTWAGLVAISTLGLVIWLIVVLYRARRPAASFGLLWFLLLLVPSGALVVFDKGEPMAEHRVYLASIGLFITLATALAWLAVRFGATRPFLRTAFRLTVALGVLSLAGHSVIRNAIWSSPISLWAEAVDKAPNHWYPALLLGESLHDAGHHAQAVGEFKRSIELRPSETGTYAKAGICLVEQGKLDEAQTMFERMLAIDPSADQGTNGLGTVALARGDLRLARQHYLDTLRNNPLNVPARAGLAAVEARAGHPAEVARLCQEIQRLAPDTPTRDDCLNRDSNRASGSGSDHP